MNNLKIKFLTECREYLPKLAELSCNELSKQWFPEASIEKSRTKLIAHLNDDKLPLALVAEHQHQPVGIACLRSNDGYDLDLSNSLWLAGLVVDPAYRGKGIAKILITAIKSQAIKCDERTLYLWTFHPTLPIWYNHIGWVELYRKQYETKQLTVMKTMLES